MKSTKQYHDSMLKLEWSWPSEWNKFIDFWGLDPEHEMWVDTSLGQIKIVRLKDLPERKTNTDVISFEIKTPNAILGFFLNYDADKIVISAVQPL